MKKRTALLLAAAALAAPLPVLAQAVVPVQFAAGASARTMTGAVQGYKYVDYRISVRAGQRLTVSLRTLSGSPYFNLMEPGSRDVAIYNSSQGEQTFSTTTTRAGAYTIRVYQMRATARRGETARFQLTVSAGRAGGVVTQLPGDALVPGTHYNATGPITCRSMEGAPMGQCKAGVIRRSGSATVHLNTPDGGERTILFRGANPVSSDSQAGLMSTRRGDTIIVRIGTVEIYEIPEAFILGG
ncbi:hypothetical protein [Novosphingobium sp.]|uniref:hypothetical protein n=1 Tax=Novosphingobium sp. TaxID=1874826 RepID=UPI0025F8F49C|nr:hypothetical protein [Novosphingobium sp.]